MVWALLLSAFVCAPTVLAQDVTLPEGVTDPAIDTKDLQDHLEYMTAEELAASAQAWVDLVQAKEKEISQANIASRSGEGTVDAVTKLREERAALVTRTAAVLAELSDKGGEPDKYQAYLDGISGVLAAGDVTDVNRLYEVVKSWMLSTEGGIKYGGKLVLFILILIAFKILASIFGGVTSKAVGRMRSSSALFKDFVSTTIRKLTFFIGLVVGLGVLGVPTGPFLAIIGAAGFVIGFALQGTLGNFAAGVMILLYRPFDLGNVVNMAGVTGKVESMNLVSTMVSTPDNQTIVVPNGSIWGNVITNINGRSTRRVDLVFGIGYGDDIAKAQGILEDVVGSHDKVLKDPAPVIKVNELADSSVNFVCRPWSNTSDYWDVYWDLTRQVKERFDKEGVSIPFPQRDVHLFKQESAAS
jgi:small conductance mechanosensitive channel